MKGPFAESVRDGFNDERLEYVDDICEEVYVLSFAFCMMCRFQFYRVTAIKCCRFQQTRVDPENSSEEFTTAAIIVRSWVKVHQS